jgi:hypothetical protein
MRLAFLCALAATGFAALLALPAAAETIESATTPFNVDKCPHKEGREVEDAGEWRCTGYGGIAVVMTSGDARVYISYGPRAAREPAARQTLAAPNREGASIEWRLLRGRDGRGSPFAAIMRWTTAIPTDDPKVENGTYRGQVWVVTRLGSGGVCHIGYVDARQNPNGIELARTIADKHARQFRCGQDKPIVLGAKGPGFSGPYGSKD